MCVPSTVVTGISVLGSALGMANSLANQKAQAAEAREQARAQQAEAFQNAKLAEENARKALLEGEKEKEKIRLEQKALQGKKTAEYGAGNIELTSGSPLNVLADMVDEGEELAQDAGSKARQKAQNYQRDAQNYYGQYSQYGQQAQKKTNPFAAANTILSGVNSIHSSLNKTSAAKRGPNYF